jgi:DNA sulfur modification protein DndC
VVTAPLVQLALFGVAPRMQMDESIRLTLESLGVYAESHDHWVIAWSGGKDSTALLTFIVWAILAGKVKAPKRLTVLYADTRMELLPLWLSAEAVREELEDKAPALAALGCALEVDTVTAPIDQRFLVYMLGRGVPPPNNTTLRWCTRQIKVDPMKARIAALTEGASGDVLTLTGVRLGESAARDGRINLSCSRGDGECGQGWYQRDLSGKGRATLAPLLHWRVCHVWEWLRSWATTEEFGDWSTSLLAEVYGGDEAEELHARTGCVGCPLATVDTALDSLLAKPQWSYLSPLKRLRPLWRRLREPAVRLRKPGGERRKDGTLVPNQHRMGPITLEVRADALAEVLSIQAEVNAAARAMGRPPIDMLNAEESARVLALIAARTWPQRWTGDEPLASEPFDEGGAQGLLFEDDFAAAGDDGDSMGLEDL